MKRRIGLLACAAGLVLAACQDNSGPSAPVVSAALQSQGTADTNVIVVLNAAFAPGSHAANRSRAAEIAQQMGFTASYTYGTAIFGFAATIPAARLAGLSRDPRVAFVSADREVSITAQTLPTGIDRIQADASSAQSGNGSGSVDIGVAIIDTGIDVDHPDLNVAGGFNCSNGPSYNDGHGHGSHVAGTVGAYDDGNGVVGVAPGARLYAVRVLNNAGSGSWAAVTCGIDWVTANAGALGIKVANMSLGGSGSDGACNSDAMHQAICNSVAAGVTYVVAAGNSNGNFSSFVPAAYDQVLTVTAMADFNGQPGGGAAATCRTDVDETPADFSNFTTAGSADANHTIAGPGVCILSAWKGGAYKTISGTSMASPHVTGVVALCIANGNCSGSPSNIISKIRQDAATQAASYGFAGDPNNPFTGGGGRGGGTTTLYYGYLVYAGSY